MTSFTIEGYLTKYYKQLNVNGKVGYQFNLSVSEKKPNSNDWITVYQRITCFDDIGGLLAQCFAEKEANDNAKIKLSVTGYFKPNIYQSKDNAEVRELQFIARNIHKIELVPAPQQQVYNNAGYDVNMFS